MNNIKLNEDLIDSIFRIVIEKMENNLKICNDAVDNLNSAKLKIISDSQIND